MLRHTIISCRKWSSVVRALARIDASIVLLDGRATAWQMNERLFYSDFDHNDDTAYTSLIYFRVELFRRNEHARSRLSDYSSARSRE